MDAKTVSFVLMMGVLGNTLFAISYYFGNIGQGIALDFSLVAAYIAGFYGGPFIGLLSGLFVGILPGIMFGPLGTGAWLGLFGLPLGKGLTGLTAGIVSKTVGSVKRQYSSLLIVPTALLAYVPECLYTYVHFAYLMPFFLGSGGAFIFFSILLKALGEITIIGFLMAALVGNHGFNNFVSGFFKRTGVTLNLETSKSKFKS